MRKRPEGSPRVALVDRHPVRGVSTEDALRKAGYVDIVRIGQMQGLLAALVAVGPGVIIANLESSSRDELEQMFVVSRAIRRPVALFVDPANAELMGAAVEAGVSAYIVDGFDKRRIRPILDMCIALFDAFTALQQELEDAKSRLAQKDVVDQAKLIIMQRHGISEDEAYAMLRTTAMNEKKRIAEVARAVIASTAMLAARAQAVTSPKLHNESD